MRTLLLLLILTLLSGATLRAQTPRLAAPDSINVPADTCKNTNIAANNSESTEKPLKQVATLALIIGLITVVVYLLYNVRSH
jgi:hypothetical protein